jgi:hypothetical protein
LTAVIRQFSISPEDGAVTQMYLATSPEIEAKNIHGQYYVPFAEVATPSGYATTQENQTKLWDFTEKILYDNVPGYAGAGI